MFPPPPPRGCRAQDFGPSSAAFPGLKQEGGLEMEQLGFKQGPIWNASAAGRRLAYHDTTPDSEMLCFGFIFRLVNFELTFV